MEEMETIPKSIPHESPEIFISYAWQDGKTVADALDRFFQIYGKTILRDNREIGFKDSIRGYMQRLGRGRYVVLVLSDGYFKSKSCMFELLELWKHADFRERIFPITVEGTSIYDAKDILEYRKYWKDKKTELQEKMKEDDLDNLQGVNEDLNQYAGYHKCIPQLLDFLRDINTHPLNDENFKPLWEKIQAQIEADQNPLKSNVEDHAHQCLNRNEDSDQKPFDEDSAGNGDGKDTLKVFILYDKEDSEIAERISNDLKEFGISPWMEKDILPGQHKRVVIRQKLSESLCVIGLFSSQSVARRGPFQRQLRNVLKIDDTRPLSDIDSFIIPVRLDDDCELRGEEKLEDLTPLNLFPDYEEGFKKLLRALTDRIQKKCDELLEEAIELSSQNEKERELEELLTRICEYGSFFEKRNNPRKARDIYQILERIDVLYVPATFRQADILFSLGNYEEATSYYIACYSNSQLKSVYDQYIKPSFKKIEKIASIHCKATDNKKAAQVYIDLYTRGETTPEITLDKVCQIGDRLFKQEEYDSAREMYEMVEAQKNYYQRAIYRIADCHLEMGNYEEALDVLMDYINSEEDEENDKQREKKRKKVFKKISEIEKRYSEEGNYEKAVDFYEEIVNLAQQGIENNVFYENPLLKDFYEHSLVKLFKLYDQTGQYSKAIDAYQQLIREIPEGIEIYQKVIDQLMQNVPVKKRIEIYQKALQLAKPKYGDFWLSF